jgi:hypothetical protein
MVVCYSMASCVFGVWNSCTRFWLQSRNLGIAQLVEGPLSQEVWDRIQNTVPIACVDVLATRKTSNAALEVGLIFRNTPHQGQRWCLIGGRLLRKDSFQTAVLRELSSALGHWFAVLYPPFLNQFLWPNTSLTDNQENCSTPDGTLSDLLSQ